MWFLLIPPVALLLTLLWIAVRSRPSSTREAMITIEGYRRSMAALARPAAEPSGLPAGSVPAARAVDDAPRAPAPPDRPRHDLTAPAVAVGDAEVDRGLVAHPDDDALASRGALPAGSAPPDAGSERAVPAPQTAPPSATVGPAADA
jgi:hypothetical protein